MVEYGKHQRSEYTCGVVAITSPQISIHIHWLNFRKNMNYTTDEYIA